MKQDVYLSRLSNQQRELALHLIENQRRWLALTGGPGSALFRYMGFGRPPEDIVSGALGSNREAHMATLVRLGDEAVDICWEHAVVSNPRFDLFTREQRQLAYDFANEARAAIRAAHAHAVGR